MPNVPPALERAMSREFADTARHGLGDEDVGKWFIAFVDHLVGPWDILVFETYEEAAQFAKSKGLIERSVIFRHEARSAPV